MGTRVSSRGIKDPGRRTELLRVTSRADVDWMGVGGWGNENNEKKKA